jgi:hypothetical protein
MLRRAARQLPVQLRRGRFRTGQTPLAIVPGQIGRGTALLEARILAEAEALDEVGILYVLRQFRQYQAEGRPLQQLVDSWQRQKEYHYWEVRLNDGFRYPTTRDLARRRLEAVDAVMAALARDLHGNDLAQLVTQPGAAPVPDAPSR